MAKKIQKTAKYDKNPVRSYLTDNELQGMLLRMTQEGCTGIAAYIRRLIILDSKQLEE